jgi:hypothetical protein
MHSTRLLAALALTLTVAACGDAPTNPELEANRQQFSEAMNGSYRFTWRKSCECSAESTAPIRITVQQGTILSALSVETEQPVSSDTLSTLKTIDGVFDMIEDAYARGAASVHVTYDPAMSFPASVGIDYSLSIADDEFSLQITDVQSFDAT